MNRFIKIFTLVFLGNALISCGDTSTVQNSNESAEAHESHDHDHDADPHHGLTDESNLDIELDNGEKWKVNEEMKPHVTQGHKALVSYMESEGTDYKALAENIQEANKGLISSCTMQGKSHDELHKWLYPHLEMVKSLEQAEDQDQANAIIHDLEHSYAEYDNYFQ